MADSSFFRELKGISTSSLWRNHFVLRRSNIWGMKQGSAGTVTVLRRKATFGLVRIGGDSVDRRLGIYVVTVSGGL